MCDICTHLEEGAHGRVIHPEDGATPRERDGQRGHDWLVRGRDCLGQKCKENRVQLAGRENKNTKNNERPMSRKKIKHMRRRGDEEIYVT
jgi:hypothetical protein